MRIDANTSAASLLTSQNALASRRLAAAANNAQASPTPAALTDNNASTAAAPVASAAGANAPIFASPGCNSPLQALMNASVQAAPRVGFNTDPLLAPAAEPSTAAAGANDPADAAPAAAGAAPGEHPKLRALLDAWGQTGSSYDLNADGTVDGTDLAELLARLSTELETAGANPQAEAAPAAGALAAPGGDNDNSIRALLQAWGQSQSAYDLNEDGTVDGLDLGMMLGRMGGSAETGGTPSVGGANEPVAQQASASVPVSNNDAAQQIAAHDNDPAAAAAASTPAAGANDVAAPSANDNPVIAANNSAAAPASNPTTNPASNPQAAPAAARSSNQLAAAAQALNVFSLAQKLMSKISFDAPGNEAVKSARGNGNDDNDSAAAQLSQGRRNSLAASLATAAATAPGADVNESPLLALRKALDGVKLDNNERGQMLRRFLAEFPRGLGVNEVA